jgi:hypothetical protein
MVQREQVVSRARLIRAYFNAMHGFFSARTLLRAHQLRDLAENLAGRLADMDRPRYWWSEE